MHFYLYHQQFLIDHLVLLLMVLLQSQDLIPTQSQFMLQFHISMGLIRLNFQFL